VNLHEQRVGELAQALGPELLSLACLFGHNRVPKVAQYAAGAGAAQRALQQQHALLAEQLLASPSPLFLIVFAAAEGAGLDAAETLKRSDAGFMKHVAAAENDLHGMSAGALSLQRGKQARGKQQRAPRPGRHAGTAPCRWGRAARCRCGAALFARQQPIPRAKGDDEGGV
jgi:hypothetical protein